MKIMRHLRIACNCYFQMDSPPSCSLSATGPLSDLGSSGIGGSISSDSVRAHLAIEMQESDIESKSLSQDSFDYSDGMCGENFNTLKKGPGWTDADGKLEVEVVDVAIKPPPEFQDSPSPPNSESSSAPILSYARLMRQKVPQLIDDYAENLVQSMIEEALLISCRISWPEGRIAPATNHVPVVTRSVYNPKRFWATDLLTPSSCQGATTLITPYNTLNRPNSRCSLASSRLSSSHNSINTSGLSHKADDSSFITSAMSHDVLTTSEISDMYNVPFDSDIYTVPIDVVRPLHDLRIPQRPKRHRHHRKRRRNVSASSQNVCCNETGNGKRHSVPGTSGRHTSRTSNGHVHNIGEPIHMTLHEVRQYLQTLYSSSSDSSENKIKRDNKAPISHTPVHLAMPKGISVNNNNRYSNPHTDSAMDTPISNKNSNVDSEREKIKKSQRNFSLNLKQTLCNIFRFKRLGSPDHFVEKRNSIVQGEIVEEEESVDSDQHANNNNTTSEVDSSVQKLPFFKRALPPLPKSNGHVGGVEQAEDALTTMVSKCESPTSIPPQIPPPVPKVEDEPAEDTSMDFAASIEKVKDYGWYWGPISGEAAEKILSNEPDGSFIVRDSSDDHYIFSLSFRLNSCVRHVRIEHDQGNFSFGSCTKFKSHTIVDFIENAVEHSRSGRYLFFLHRRPVLGPMRVQLLHPVSRFKQVQSLQHTCRFVILKMVRRDLIPTLPLPRRLIDYLSTPHYYSEQLAEQDDRVESPVSSSTGELEKICFTPQGLS
ncbi:Suppressor of cytokine signaling 7 [Eufriesea mexicana]|uniref:Suppressor of cytokine signaling 7 n=1 Tax=Eufriesea mexicana TaxID=516756 RepID=A0A310SDG3_9HYME|nr:Suppressor of cytokine signaling 7 [Eufriesea mexicana]